MIAKITSNYANNQFSKFESGPEKKTNKFCYTLYSKAQATTLTGNKFTGKVSEKKVPCSQASKQNKKF